MDLDGRRFEYVLAVFSGIRVGEKLPFAAREPQNITDYMVSENQVPIMTQSDSLLQLRKRLRQPATALNILRETFSAEIYFAFPLKLRQRWKFKRPEPADFFVDGRRFRHGWMVLARLVYSTEHVDISIENVRLFQINTNNPEVEKEILRKQAK